MYHPEYYLLEEINFILEILSIFISILKNKPVAFVYHLAVTNPKSSCKFTFFPIVSLLTSLNRVYYRTHMCAFYMLDELGYSERVS